MSAENCNDFLLFNNLPGDLVQNGGEFFGGFSVVSVSPETKHGDSNNSGKIRSISKLSVQNLGRINDKFREFSFCAFSDLALSATFAIRVITGFVSILNTLPVIRKPSRLADFSLFWPFVTFSRF